MDELLSRTDMELAFVGCLLGTAVGDALGLACEGLTRQRQLRLYPTLDGMRLVGRHGMVSDDTEHTCMVAQALIASAGDTDKFQRDLARRLRLWLLGVPAGIGWATLRSLMKLCLGVTPDKSGVNSAGNGPAMRSALIGVCYGDDFAKMRPLVRVSTRLTHTDPKAEIGALAVAVAAFVSSRHFAADTLSTQFLQDLDFALGQRPGSDEFLELADRAAQSVDRGETTQEFAMSIGAVKGVSGYIYQTVPMVLHAWLRNPTDFRTASLEIIRCGGDTDTTAAILGAIIGARVGKSGVPDEWLSSLWERPRSVAWMESLGQQLSDVCDTKVPQKAQGLPIVPLLLRNAFFAAIVLTHGFRRLLPPY